MDMSRGNDKKEKWWMNWNSFSRLLGWAISTQTYIILSWLINEMTTNTFQRASSYNFLCGLTWVSIINNKFSTSLALQIEFLFQWTAQNNRKQKDELWIYWHSYFLLHYYYFFISFILCLHICCFLIDLLSH